MHSHEIQREADKNYVVGKMNNGLVSNSYGSQVLLMDSFRGDTFVTTRRGQTLEVDLNQDNIEKLRNHFSEFSSTCLEVEHRNHE